MFKQYIDYLKNNPEGFWFRRKLYGWGWTPAKWQGWAVIGGFVFFVIFQAILLNYTPQSNTDITLYLLTVFFSVIALLLICKITGEKPKWQWGIPKKDNDQ